MKFTSAGCWGHFPVQVGAFGCLGKSPTYRQPSWWPCQSEAAAAPAHPLPGPFLRAEPLALGPCWSCAPTVLLGPGQAPPERVPRAEPAPEGWACPEGSQSRVPTRLQPSPAQPGSQPRPELPRTAELPRLPSHLLCPSHLLPRLLPGRAPGPDWPFPEPAPAKSQQCFPAPKGHYWTN